MSVVILAVIVTGCSSRFSAQGNAPSPSKTTAPSSSSTSGKTQTSNAGSVTVDVTLNKTGNSVVFDVSMNTHSVELDQYNLGELSTLRDGAGKEYKPTSWKSAPGGHHREGVLTFTLPESATQLKYLELVILDVAVKERVLKWQL